MPNVKPVVAYLRQLEEEFSDHKNPSKLAADHPAVTIDEPRYGLLTIRTNLGDTKLKLVVAADVGYIGDRADRLTRYARQLGSGYTRANKQFLNRAKRPPISRPKYSPRIHQQFVDDGEIENARSYYNEYHD